MAACRDAGARTRAASGSPVRRRDRVPRQDDAVRRHPRLDVASGTEKPDVVVIDQPFQVTLGLQPRRDGSAGRRARSLDFAAQRDDRARGRTALRPGRRSRSQAAPRASSSTTSSSRSRSTTLTCIATLRRGARPRTPPGGLQLHRDGQVVGVAWRTGRAVHRSWTWWPVRRSAAPRGRAPRPRPAARRRATRPRDLGLPRRRRLDDVRVDGVRRRPGRPRAGPAEHQHARRRRRGLRDDAASHDRVLRRRGRRLLQPRRAGRADRPRRAEGIQDAIRTVLQTPGRTAAPSVLLLTEELVVPWELATLTLGRRRPGVVPRRSSARTSPSPGGHSRRTSHARNLAAASPYDRRPC